MAATKPESWSPPDRLRTSSTVVIVAALVLGAVVVPAAYGAGADGATDDTRRGLIGQYGTSDTRFIRARSTTDGFN